MVRIKKAGYVVLCLFVCFLLCACQKNRGISEEEIIERIPEEFLMVDYETLSYDKIEIEKRIQGVFDLLEFSFRVTPTQEFSFYYSAYSKWLIFEYFFRYIARIIPKVNYYICIN